MRNIYEAKMLFLRSEYPNLDFEKDSVYIPKLRAFLHYIYDIKGIENTYEGLLN